MISKNIYNKENQTIDFQKDYVLIKIGNVYKKKILYTEISCLFFNMDKDGYYFRLQDKGAEQYHFDYKFNTRYRMINKKNLIEKVKNKKINLVPNFGWDGQGDGIMEYCIMVKKYFLTITRIPDTTIYNRNNLLAINYGNINRNFYKIMNDNLKEFNLKKELLISHNNNELEEYPFNYGSKGLYILDKSLTFGMGYAITAIEILEAISPSDTYGFPTFVSTNIFYSFDKKEIKKKIIEFLSFSYSMEHETYG